MTTILRSSEFCAVIKVLRRSPPSSSSSLQTRTSLLRPLFFEMVSVEANVERLHQTSTTAFARKFLTTDALHVQIIHNR